MDEKERRKLLGLLLINSGIFYIQGKKAYSEILMDERMAYQM